MRVLALFDPKRFSIVVSVAVLVALGQFRLVLLIFGQNYQNSVDAARGVLEGMPHWVVYQSRVLGPYCVELLSRLVGDFSSAHAVFFIIWTSIAGVIVQTVFAEKYDRGVGWFFFVFFHLLFSLLMNGMWMYSWDSIGLVTFLLFVHFAISRRGWLWFVCLFVFSILNRESAFFIAMWMVVDPVLRIASGQNKERREFAMLCSGVFCLASGWWLIVWLRAHLLVREIGPELFGLQSRAGQMAHLQLNLNIDFIGNALRLSNYGCNLFIVSFLLVVAILAVVLSFKSGVDYLSLCLVHLALVVSILLFGIVFETRVLLELIPFVMFSIAELWSRRGVVMADKVKV